MDLNKYDKLRSKINKKDFEGNNKGLDRWLYGFSFVGNIGSVFFAYFLVYPALLKAISINIVDGFWGTALSFLFANTFLVIFEIIKRYLVKNFSSDYVANNGKLKASIMGWFTVATAIVLLSFYLSVVGSKNFGTTSGKKNLIAQVQIDSKKDSLSIQYERKKKTFEEDNQILRSVTNDLRQTLVETPINYVSARKEYQASIDKNVKSIENNQAEINKIDEQLKQRIEELKSDLIDTKKGNANEDNKNIVLFIIIAVFIEIMIIGGVYFREWFEYNLYMLNQQKFEKIYLKKDRYKSLISFVYKEGKITIGEKVISGVELKELVREKTTIQNPNKFVDDFLHDMDSIGVFNTVGKRRFIAVNFAEALSIVDKFDDTLRILENMK
jgi:hypothetical protein